MKKFLALALLFGSSVILVPAAESTPTAENTAATIEANAVQRRVYQPQRRNRRARVVTRTRIVRVGYRTYREVVQYRYLPNGRVTVRVLSRSRVR